jgi:hypothetical protein
VPVVTAKDPNLVNHLPPRLCEYLTIPVRKPGDREAVVHSYSAGKDGGNRDPNPVQHHVGKQTGIDLLETYGRFCLPDIGET